MMSRSIPEKLFQDNFEELEDKYLFRDRHIWSIEMESDKYRQEILEENLKEKLEAKLESEFGRETAPKVEVCSAPLFYEISDEDPDAIREFRPTKRSTRFLFKVLVKTNEKNRDEAGNIIEKYLKEVNEFKDIASEWWYMGSEPDSICRGSQPGTWGGGGPGGLPLPHLPKVNEDDYKFNWVADQPEGLPKTEDLMANKGEGVHVVILDTAPREEAFKAIGKNNRDKNPSQMFNGLLEKLYAVYDTQFKIIDDFLSLEDEHDIAVKLAEEEWATYPLVDHGLFIAGIIHSIAPKAKITLYRVLNDRGVSTRWDILCAYFKAVDPFNDKADPIIVNCSFTIGLPWAEKNRDRPGITELVWFLVGANETVVGAAGNEGLDEKKLNVHCPPYPRYPAAFNKTLGVTALNKDHKRACYANWAEDYDLPDDIGSKKIYDIGKRYVSKGSDRKGIATMGGDVIRLGHLSITHPNDSILGLYTSYDGLPGYVYTALDSHNGWARWSGTSFSTAIVNGVLALIASYQRSLIPPRPTDQNTLVGILEKYCDSRFEPTAQYPKGTLEHILKVTQGP